MKSHTPKPLKSGWTRWQYPVMKDFLMVCCDCGLVHQMEFKAVRVIGRADKPTWTGEELDIKRYRVKMRARRANDQ